MIANTDQLEFPHKGCHEIRNNLSETFVTVSVAIEISYQRLDTISV